MSTEDAIVQAPALPWMRLPPWHATMLLDLTRRRDALPHALLVHGPAGIGKHALALHVAQALLCEAQPAAGGACGVCAGCRYVLAGQHPDLVRLELATLDQETGEPASVEHIGIERVRAMIDLVQITSHRGGAKVAVITPAERMNLAAANALLKTLEEPPGNTHLLLVSHQPGRLPATIVSRCRRLPIVAPDVEEARAWLRGEGVAEPDLVLAQAGGAPLAALAIADPGTQQERRAWLDALAHPRSLRTSALAARIEAGGREERKRRLELATGWLLGWTEDLARTSARLAPARNPDFAAPLAALGPRVAQAPLFRYHRTLLEQRGLLAHPLQPRLVAEALLVDYRNLFEASDA